MTYLSYLKKLGGLQMILQYAKCGVLGVAVKNVLANPLSLHSFKRAYQDALGIVEPMLRDKYSQLMRERKLFYSSQALGHNSSKLIWFCWLQGLEKAPEVVKVCYESICKNLSDRRVTIIDGQNWYKYIQLPDYIVQKWKKKQIPPAHFTDLIRLQLLIQYGGTWIDSTVLCTGLTSRNMKETLSYLDADLFMFQYTKPGSNQWRGIGNWFISSCTNNEVLMVLRDMLYAYWRDYDCVLDYFIFHLFFSMLREVYPNEIGSMPYGFASRSVALGYHLGDKFNEEQWNKLTTHVCFHKLTYSLRKSVLKSKENYYNHIMASFGRAS